MPEDAPAHADSEVKAMTVWPTIGAYPLGRLVGQLAGIRTGIGGFFTVGKLLAVATIPIAVLVYAWQLFPFVCRRYTLTNRRVVIQKGLSAAEERSIYLNGFDAIDVEILPGQSWLQAGELIFKQNDAEVLRLSGVSRPAVFRQICLKARSALISVGAVFERQQAADNEAVAS